MAATSFGDVPLPLNNRMIGDPLDVERITQAVRQDKRRPREATTRIRRRSSANESGLCDDRVAFIKVELIDGLFLDELVPTVRVFLPERCQTECVGPTVELTGRHYFIQRTAVSC